MTHGWFITGTDTGVGKTEVALALLGALVRAGRRALGMKPIASGSRRTEAGWRNADAERLLAAGSLAVRYEWLNPYVFEPAIAPHIAAAQVGTAIDTALIKQAFDQLSRNADSLVVEGAGGWRVPIGPTLYISDVARELGLPVILVVGIRLGCINHALLTAQAINADDCCLAGWVANHIDASLPAAAAAVTSIRERLAAPLLGEVKTQATDADWRVFGDLLTARLTNQA